MSLKYEPSSEPIHISENDAAPGGFEREGGAMLSFFFFSFITLKPRVE